MAMDIGRFVLFMGINHSVNPKNFYKVWMKIGMFLGYINTTILLSIVFFVFMTPIGFIMKLFGYRPLNDKFNAKANTYRKQSIKMPDERMEVPF